MFDAAVIGGGLAGSVAAITLARQKRHVVLFEAKAYPHHKVCGEFLSPECLPIFEEIGFRARLEAIKPAIIRTVRITAPDGSQWRTRFPSDGLGISRYTLDAALADYARALGVEVRSGVRVTDVQGNLAQGFSLDTRDAGAASTVQARTVIAAHGKHSALDGKLGRGFARPTGYVGLKRHFKGMALGDHLDLHVFPGGYCGMSDVEGGKTNVCLLVEGRVFQRAFADGRPDIEQFIQWMRGQNQHLEGWLSRAVPAMDEWISIGQIPMGMKSPLEGDVLLAGDAAGMVAPLAGDGMAMALHGGRLAAYCMERYLAGQISARQLKQHYAGEWQRTFSARIRLTGVLHALILRPALLSPSLKLLNLIPPLGNFLVTQTRDLRLVER
jgi:flavin-dependent dehydrogenase